MRTKPSLLTISSALLLPTTLLVAGCDLDCTLDHLVDSIHEDCGQAVTREFDITGFEEIECGDAFELTVRQGNQERVSVTFPEGLDDERVVRRDGTHLRIGYDGCFCAGGARRAVVELPRLARIDAAGASRVTLQGIASSDIVTIEASGASRVSGDLSANQARIRLSGASHVGLQGSTSELDLSASGASRAELVRFEAARATVRLDGTSVATVNVRERLNVHASGGSRLEYQGDPHFDQLDLSGGARIERID